MKRQALAAIIGWSVLAAAVGALLTGGQRAVSLQILLAIFVAWFAAATMNHFLSAVPLKPSRPRLLIDLRFKRAAPERDRRPRELKSVESLVARACDNERVHEQQLRPRLTALANHLLAMNHGIDRAANPKQAAVLLGDVAWLIESTNPNRKPTTDELNEFLDRVNGPAVKEKT